MLFAKLWENFLYHFGDTTPVMSSWMCSKTYSSKNASQYTRKVGRYGPFQNFIFTELKASLRPQNMEGNKKISTGQSGFSASNFVGTIPHSMVFQTLSSFFLCQKVLFLAFLVLSCGVVSSFPSSFNSTNSRDVLVLCISGKAVFNIAKAEKQFQLKCK